MSLYSPTYTSLFIVFIYLNTLGVCIPPTWTPFFIVFISSEHIFLNLYIFSLHLVSYFNFFWYLNIFLVVIPFKQILKSSCMYFHQDTFPLFVFHLNTLHIISYSTHTHVSKFIFHLTTIFQISYHKLFFSSHKHILVLFHSSITLFLLNTLI